ncbi:MAG: 6,7-dimethyl-8-ribityllumazine synthase [Bacteroidia bacterium]
MASRAKVYTPAERNYSVSGKRIGIAVAQWHNDITDVLLHGALDVLKKAGIKASDIIIMQAPGSFELPLTAQWLIKDSIVDAVLCLGCIVKGQTPHFHYISQAVAQGIMKVGIEHNIPVIFGVLTTNTLQQAKERSGGKHGNKGADAAVAALEMLENRKR